MADSRATYMWHTFPAEVNDAVGLPEKTSEAVTINTISSLKKSFQALVEAAEKDITIVVSSYVSHNSVDW